MWVGAACRLITYIAHNVAATLHCRSTAGVHDETDHDVISWLRNHGTSVT